MQDNEYSDKNDPLGMIRQYEQTFGAGSWAELERGVKERHPEIYALVKSPILDEPKEDCVICFWALIAFIVIFLSFILR